MSANDTYAILTLDLELLGLRIQLNEIELDITGETGFGNLLCAIADIGSGGLDNILEDVLQDLFDLINRLLGSLST